MDICTFESGEEIGYYHFYLCRSYVPFSEIVCKGHFLVESKCKYGIFFPDQTFHKIFSLVCLYRPFCPGVFPGGGSAFSLMPQIRVYLASICCRRLILSSRHISKHASGRS